MSFATLILACASPAFPSVSGINYVCPTDEASLCSDLGSVAAVYDSVFSNANATIYVEYGNTGLGESSYYWNPVSYTSYLSALTSHSGGDTVQTDALASLPGTEPSLYSGADVNLTAALEQALGISSSPVGITASGGACFIGSTGCYDGLITLSDTANFYIGTGTVPSGEYDLDSVVEHETDEVLGTSSCVSTTSGSLSDSCGTNSPSAVDLFRYNDIAGQVQRVLMSSTAGAYFSYNGGTSNGADGAVYNTAANGLDFADFTSSCTFVQDAVGCTGQSFDITTDGPGGTYGPEITILNAIGYNETPAPEPATTATSGLGFAALGWIVWRRQRRARV